VLTFFFLVDVRDFMPLTLRVHAEGYRAADVYFFYTYIACIYGRSNSTKSPASGARVSEPDVTSRESARNRVRVDQCVPAVRAVEEPVFACLRSNCSHVTERAVRSVRLAPKVVMQNGGGFVDITRL
jgi:hypothetical protein